VDVDRDLAQAVVVLTSVVAAEQKLAAGGEHDADVCLGAAAIAAVNSR
jgi:hypothetical protein